VRAGIAIAETEEDWQTAMQLYRALPEGDAAKSEGLRRAKLRWRLSVLPDYAREALHAEALDRRQFAVVLVSLAPRLETLPGGEVPLLSDIMHLSGQREILTVVRLGLLDADRMEHLFYPHREIDEAEAREAIDGLASLLELGPPGWCAFDPPPCRDLGQPVSGTDVTSVVIEMMSREAE
jgi:hypothetical protein